MKSLRIIACVLSLILVPVLMDSCGDKCDCCDTSLTPKEFTINDMFLTVTTSSGTQPVPHSINPGSMVFKFEMSVSYAQLNHIDSNRGTMGMAAYACDPVPPASKQKFTSLRITSDKTFTTNNGQTFAAGSDLSSKFLLTDFVMDQELHVTQFHFTPVFGVSAKAEHNLTFAFTLDDGRTLSLQSGFYELIP